VKFPLTIYRRAFMNIEDLKKRKELLETNLKQVNERITSDTQQAFRIQGGIIDVSEIIAEEEKKEKEEKEKKEEKPDKKVK
jgi:hypothetical protein